jgi:hypothetical protein
MRTRLSRLRANVWEAWLGLVTLVTIAQQLLGPVHPVEKAAGHWAWAWVGTYGASGVLVLAGILLARRDVEALGLMLLAAGAVVNGLAVFALHRPAAERVLFVVDVGSLVLACLVRVRQILRRQQPVVVQQVPE